MGHSLSSVKKRYSAPLLCVVDQRQTIFKGAELFFAPFGCDSALDEKKPGHASELSYVLVYYIQRIYITCFSISFQLTLYLHFYCFYMAANFISIQKMNMFGGINYQATFMLVIFFIPVFFNLHLNVNPCLANTIFCKIILYIKF